MAFQPTVEDLKRSQKCPVGMHLATVVEVEDEYFNEKGTSVQKVDFETDKGYVVSNWFNNKMMSSILEFVAAADDVVLSEDNMPANIELKDYKGKRVAISVSHTKDKNNKLQANIDNFFSASKVPF